ncbi:MAG: flagellar M-ring protein FliF, partial [Pseudomonadota bacterium]|nr:flagellar M-ring protein FliF [Pseudomonadota bacterium]
MDMDLSSSPTTLTAPQSSTLAVGPTRLTERFTALPPRRRVMLAGGVAAMLALIIASVIWSSRPEYRVLFSNLSDKDGGAIVAQLSKMNVPYRFSEGGGAVLVPADQVHDVRLKLAQAGLPKGSAVGFELMDTARVGTTQFQERLNFQRGLEGELVRSITALSAVEAARVHLAIPNQNGFFRDQQKPSASVLLTLYPGQTLDRGQVAGIVHLVSASVPEMSPRAVSVLDQTGALLSESGDGSGPTNMLDPGQMQHVSRIEQMYVKRILDILEPVIGRDNLRAQVSADIDFSQTELTTEEFRPNQGGQPAAVRSAQTSENLNGAGTQAVGGVPGAASNQPVAGASAPVNGAEQAMQPMGGGSATASSGRRDAVTNYELDKTVRVVRAATGTVRRLAVAVVVNHRSVTDKKGQQSAQPLSQEELDKLTALVQESVGFVKDRGDTVRVVNAPFRPVAVDTSELPLWKQPQLLEMVRTLAVPLALVALGLAVVFGVIR